MSNETPVSLVSIFRSGFHLETQSTILVVNLSFLLATDCQHVQKQCYVNH